MKWFPYISRCITADGRLVVYRRRVVALSRREFDELLDKWNSMYAHRSGLPKYNYSPDLVTPVVKTHNEHPIGHSEDVERIFDGPYHQHTA